MDRGKRLVFFSPHFDDAVGSCGGLIAHLVGKGLEIWVTTIFAGMCQTPLSAFAEELQGFWGVDNAVESRRSENDLACGVLRASVRNYDFIEAVYRTNGVKHLYSTEEELFATLCSEDADLPLRLCEYVEADCAKEDILVFPAGIGDHADHRIAAETGILLLQKGRTVYFYRDFCYEGRPFASVPEATLLYRLATVDYEAKLQAILQYRSQTEMLFGTSGADAYYKGFLLPDGSHYEQYFGAFSD
jgi:hypothetical protein